MSSGGERYAEYCVMEHVCRQVGRGMQTIV